MIVLKVIFRLMALPLIIGLIILTSVKEICIRSWLFMKYGGEWNTFDKKVNQTTIREVFEEIQQGLDEEL